MRRNYNGRGYSIKRTPRSREKSDQLSAKLNIPIIRKDDFYDVVASYTGDHEQRNKISYGILFRLLQTNAFTHMRFILDFSFNKEEEMRNFIMWLENQKYSFKSILCICSDEKTWADRLNIRKIDPLPNQMITDFDELKKYYTDLSTKPFDGELVVDTVEAVDSIIDKAIAFLQ